MKSKYLKTILIVLVVVLLSVLIKVLPPKKQFNICQNLNTTSQKLQCWEELIDSTLNSSGINQAFEIVGQLYKSEPVFVSNCHDFVHLIGKKAYQKFSNQEDFNFSSKSYYCGYGFYHSFMEALLTDKADLTKARQFCDLVDRKMHSQNADAKGACYHGIGHGVADNHAQNTWQNEAELTSRALDLCEKVSEENVFLNRCSSGVFNVLAIAYKSNRLKINKADPLWFCRQLQKDVYKTTCYEEMNTTLFVLSGKDFLTAAKFIEDIKEDEFASSGIRSLAGVFGMSLVQDSNFDKSINDCRKLQTRLRFACIKGFVSGLIEGGSPGGEYVKAINFCKTKILEQNEKQTCFEELLRLSGIFYPKEKQELVCNLVDSKFRKYCQ